MARVPESEIERLKASVSLLRLVEAGGHVLKTQGRDRVLCCPFHEGDATPSCVLTPDKNVWHCFGCGAGGTVIDWVMRTRSVSFRHAVELLRKHMPDYEHAPAFSHAAAPRRRDASLCCCAWAPNTRRFCFLVGDRTAAKDCHRATGEIRRVKVLL